MYYVHVALVYSTGILCMVIMYIMDVYMYM